MPGHYFWLSDAQFARLQQLTNKRTGRTKTFYMIKAIRERLADLDHCTRQNHTE